MSPPIERAQIDRLVVDQLPSALRFAQRLTGRTDLAEEIVQEALVKVLRHWPDYRGEASFATWLLGIVLNTYRDSRRGQRDMHPLPSEVIDPCHSAECFRDASDLAERLRRAIDELPGRQREIALLCLVEQVPPCEAAMVLETTPANIHTTLHLIRKKLLPLVDIERPCRHE